MDSVRDHLAVGFPHSEIDGSKPARGSPSLIAACYVLHRLSVPRHPRNALLTLDRILRRGKPNTGREKHSEFTRHACVRRTEARPAHAPDQKNLFTMTKSSLFARLRPSTFSRRQGRFPSEQDQFRKPVAAPAGGASRDRTGDLKLAKLALSQLSYGPLPAPPATVTPHAKHAAGDGGPGRI